MAKRQVFFSFRFLYDSWRASQIREMGRFSNEFLFSDNDWETVRSNSENTIKKWINDQMKMRSCVVLLIGEHTQGRKWINYEIETAWNAGKGIVGIYVHGLKDECCEQSKRGKNPLEDFCIDTSLNYIAQHKAPVDGNEINLAEVVKAYDPPYSSSTDVYYFIEHNIVGWIEEAIVIRSKYPK